MLGLWLSIAACWFAKPRASETGCLPCSCGVVAEVLAISMLSGTQYALLSFGARELRDPSRVLALPNRPRQ